MVHRRIGGIAAVLFLLLGSCGESTTPQAPPEPPSPASAFPMTITDDDGAEVTIAEEPERIVTFAPSMTEIVFELGIGDRLVGVSGPFDDYPAEAKDIEEVGGAGDFGVDPTIEKVVSLEPDLFLTIPGGDQWKQRLRELEIPVVTLHADTFDDLLTDIETMGVLTGAVDEAGALAERMRSEADAIAESAEIVGPVSCFFEVYYPPLTTVGPNTFIYDLLQRAGCDPVTGEATSDYPEWSVDALVADGPQVYLVTPESAKSVAAVSKRPGFTGIPAIEDGRVELVDGDLVTRAGPRVIEGLRELSEALGTV
ncbi:MAG TPA: helical backbone metal receptor [Actinomycetota bacterium]|nr:helical backbone metal receptor [Actinomycetota bacterium]